MITIQNQLRLLIVDDNIRARGALAAYLSTLDGIHVSGEASNGLEALAMLQTQNADIVLMDERTSGMGGLEIAQIMRLRWPDVKLIILAVFPDSRNKALSVGAAAFLMKGCSPDELTSTIRSVAAL